MPRNRYQELPVDVRRKNEIVKNRVAWLIILTIIALFTFLTFLLSVNLGFILARGMTALPSVKVLQDWHPYESTRIYDRKGVMVANIHGDEDRVVVPLSEISPNIQRAVMAIEDNRFYRHSGVDLRGTIRAAITNFSGGEIQGGSTLTQQLVKNLFLSPERSLSRKLAEALLAIRVEQYYDKNTILAMYLNQVYWGNHSYGIEKASRRYFQKPARDLTIAQSALLAGLLKAPEGLSPYQYPKAARNRQLAVLNAMVKFGYINEAQKKEASTEPITLSHKIPKPSKHPFFVQHVIMQLEKLFGANAIRKGGLKVFTTMDVELQTVAEKSLIKKLDQLKGTGAEEGSFVVQRLSNGHILALVGGRDFHKNQFNHATQQKRAIGSTFKPFVYLTAFRKGVVTPDSIVADSPICLGNWCPRNWDGKYMGRMTVRRALTLSRNTPTIKVGNKVGIEAVIETASLAGISSRIDPNASSFLGSAGITPYEVIRAFSTIARGGVFIEPTAIMRIEDSRGKEIDLPERKPERRFQSEPIYNLISILIDVVEKGTGRNARLAGRQVAGKTGTTDNNRDIWFTGFTTDMVGSVWIGNDDYNVSMPGIYSSNAAAVWGDFAKQYYALYPTPAVDFPTPEKILVENRTLGVQLENQAEKAEELAAPETQQPISPQSPSYGYSPLHPGPPSSPSGQTTSPDTVPQSDPDPLDSNQKSKTKKSKRFSIKRLFGIGQDKKKRKPLESHPANSNPMSPPVPSQ
ncbi:MAG: transglycosylase domain-containing protein [Cyanobacteria bacterium P01_H01_bin.74]